MSLYTSAHRRHVGWLRAQPVAADDAGLKIGEQYVMFFAERKLMREHAHNLVVGRRRVDVLEVGLGLGVFAEQLSTLGCAVDSYIAVEPHPGVADLTVARLASAAADLRLTTVIEPWQHAIDAIADRHYDVIMYDTWPPKGHADADFASFVDVVVQRCLRPGGRFSFFQSGRDIGNARRAVMDSHFTHWSTRRYVFRPDEVPAQWTKETTDFVIPVAVRQ